MAEIDVKITDLEPVSTIQPNDLFLVSKAFMTSGVLNLQMPYTSNALSGASLSSELKKNLENDTLSINNTWHFHGGVNHIPTQDAKLNVDDLSSALEDETRLSSIINDEKDGWYKGLSSSVLQNNQQKNGETQSISVVNNSVPNIDFVERAVAIAYQSLLNQLTNIVNGAFIPSQIGDIVFSTKLSTASDDTDGNGVPSENNIRRYYGYGQVINGVHYPNTKWIQHSGYFLRGADENVSFNNNTNDGNSFGGSDEKTYEVPLKSHYHKLGPSASNNGSISGSGSALTSISVKGDRAEVNSSESGWAVTSVTGNSGSINISGSFSFDANAKTNSTGEDPAKMTINTIPRYKNVYIWERIA